MNNLTYGPIREEGATLTQWIVEAVSEENYMWSMTAISTNRKGSRLTRHGYASDLLAAMDAARIAQSQCLAVWS
jgi:hypothetical protein